MAANEFKNFGGVYGGHIFFGGFSAESKISAAARKSICERASHDI